MALFALLIMAPANPAQEVGTTAPPPPNEVRALWVVRTTLTSPEKIHAMVECAHANSFNTLIVQVRGRGDAYYRSQWEPRAAASLKDQLQSFDPLALTVAEAKRKGLKVHAGSTLTCLPTSTNCRLIRRTSITHTLSGSPCHSPSRRNSTRCRQTIHATVRASSSGQRLIARNSSTVADVVPPA